MALEGCCSVLWRKWRALRDSNPCFRRERANTRTPANFHERYLCPFWRYYLPSASAVVHWLPPTDTPQKLPKVQRGGKWPERSAMQNSKPAPLGFGSQSVPSPTGVTSKQGSPSGTGGGPMVAPGLRGGAMRLAATPSTGSVLRTICRTPTALLSTITGMRKGPQEHGGAPSDGAKRDTILVPARSPWLTR